MPETTTRSPDIDRLRWQCRRGMLELDEILLAYLDREYRQASSADQSAFRRLLAIEDPILNQWLLLDGVADVGLRGIVRRVRGCSELHG